MDTKLIILSVIVILIIIGLVVYFMFVHESNRVLQMIKKTKNWDGGVMWDDVEWVATGKFIFEIKSDKKLMMKTNTTPDGSMKETIFNYKRDGSDSIIIKIDGEKSAKMYIKDKYLVFSEDSISMYLLPETNVE
jgi:hypothetical protein